MRDVTVDAWEPTLAGLRAEGYVFLDFLTGVDRIETVEVLAHVVAPSTMARILVRTQVPVDDARLASITGTFPGAAWHERETAELLGVEFIGHPDPRPLLLRTSLGSAPLRRSTVLAARVVTPWPGAADVEADRRGARRRQLPAGVPDAWLSDGPS